LENQLIKKRENKGSKEHWKLVIPIHGNLKNGKKVFGVKILPGNTEGGG
jgi:hypothetical protein